MLLYPQKPDKLHGWDERPCSLARAVQDKLRELLVETKNELKKERSIHNKLRHPVPAQK